MVALRTARERARAQVTQEILDEARRQLAEEGATSLSLRSVARQLGMASSALYRYFASRDELLTALIIDAYDAIGEAAEQADAAVERHDIERRWRVVCDAVRAWARARPHEYALVYGSPVPGYQAPLQTVAPATRITSVLAAILRDAAAHGRLDLREDDDVAPGLRRDVARLATVAVPGVPAAAVVRGLVAWTQLFGVISFELFGHLHGAVEDEDAFFATSVTMMGHFVGL